MPDYSTLISTIVQESRAREASLTLLDESCHSQFLLQPTRSRKVFLFFHGFTATPIQFMPLGKTLFEAGYSVLIPLLPGHGLAGNWDESSPPPLPEDPAIYQQFGQFWLERVQDLGAEIWVGGLSGGATLAAWLALQFPQNVDRALLFAPYLSSTNVVVDWLVRLFNGYFAWQTEPGLTHFGYDGFRMPALEVFLYLGKYVLEQAKDHPAAPMLIISSEKDSAVNINDHKTLFESVLKHHPQSWYHCFDATFNMPHTMMTEAEGNRSVALLISVAKAYVESNLTWAEVQEIRDRIAQGNSFDAVISELNVQQRTSADLITLVTLQNR